MTQLKAHDFRSENKPVWCPRCGDYGLLSALYKTLEMFQQPPHETVLVSGIGCASRLPGYVNTYGFHGVHGRLLPVAMGIKMANPQLKVIGIGGDGDGLAIGLGHFLHATRRNLDVLYILVDNNVYGLTKGQSSPTTQLEHHTKSNPFHIDGPPMNPVPLALSAGASFVARLFAGDMQSMLNILPQAFEHKGFAFVHALSPCTVFHDTFQLYFNSVKPLPETHKTDDKINAMQLGMSNDPIYSGVFFNQEQETLLDRVNSIKTQKQQTVTVKDIARTWSR